MFYPLKVNTSLVQLGIKLNKINEKYRSESQRLAKRLGYTPQEAAVLIASQIPLEYSPSINEVNLYGWVNKGKIRLHIFGIWQAVDHVMGLFHDLSYE